jgi:lipopolysaccharide export system permease protein
MADYRTQKSSWRTPGPYYLLTSTFVPIRNTFVYVILILESVRFKLVLGIALHQPDPALSVLKFLGLWLPLYVGIALQIALFVGLMFGFAQICKARELDALHSVGYGLHQLMAPILGLGVVVWLLSILILGWLQPLALYASKVFLHEMEQSVSIMIAGTNVFLTREHRTIMLDGLSDNGNQFRRVFIYEVHPDGKTVATAGTSGFLLEEGDVKTQHYFVKSLDVMELTDKPSAGPGPGLGNEIKDSTTSYLENVQGPLDRPAKSLYRARGLSEYEWTLGELLWGNSAIPFRIESYKLSAEMNYRLAQLMFILVLPLMAAVTVIEPRRNPGPLRFFLGLLFVLGFYQYLRYGTSLSRNNLLSPLITLWLPVAVVYVLVTAKFWKLAYRPAFQSAR